jgi:hypothetical protein
VACRKLLSGSVSDQLPFLKTRLLLLADEETAHGFTSLIITSVTLEWYKLSSTASLGSATMKSETG